MCDDQCYVHNVFMKLNDIFSKNPDPLHSDYNMLDRGITDTVKHYLQDVLRQCQNETEKDPNILNADYHFAIILPTNWDYDIRKKLIRPLFIAAGIIKEEDDDNRLLFFNKLESNFRYLQFLIGRGETVHKPPMISNGKQYIMCTMNFVNNEQHIDLDLFSAHYPFFSTNDNNYVPRLLMSIALTIPLNTHNTVTDIESCLKKHNVKIKTTKLIEKLAEDYEAELQVKYYLCTRYSDFLITLYRLYYRVNFYYIKSPSSKTIDPSRTS